MPSEKKPPKKKARGFVAVEVEGVIVMPDCTLGELKTELKRSKYSLNKEIMRAAIKGLESQHQYRSDYPLHLVFSLIRHPHK